jgi:MFS family permease
MFDSMVFQSKNYTLFVISLGIFVDLFSYSVVLPFMPTIVQTAGQESSITGVILAFYSAGLLLGSLVFGVISDHLNSKRMLMLWSLVGMILASISMGISQNLYLLSVGRFFQGISSAAIWVLGLALIAETYEPEEIGLKMGFVFGAYSLGNFMGPLLGGYLFKLGSGVPFYVTAGIALLDLLLRYFLKEPPSTAKGAHSSMWDGFRGIKGNGPVLRIMFFTAVAAVILGSLEVNVVLLLKSRYLLQEDIIGLIFIAFVVPELIFSPLAGLVYDKIGFRYTTIPSSVLASGVIGLMCLDVTLPVFIVLLALLATFFMVGLTPVLPELSKRVPGTTYGTTYGVFNFMFGIGLLIGPIYGTLVYQYSSWAVFCATLCACYLFCVPILWI